MDQITENHLLSGSQDILAGNIQKLKEIFPEVFSEDRIDFEKLQVLLGDLIAPKDDLYGLNWWGKYRAIQESMKRSLGTLRPDKDSSKNWDTTENLFIEGDNLEVIKLLQKSYNNRVKMIYIDPPYNTGNDFVYNDNFTDSIKNYLDQTGQVNSAGLKQSTNTKVEGRYHSNWLNMMYPRLKLAKNLLTEDGVIFISIDDNEVANLKEICNEIFGEQNFTAQIIWEQGKKALASQIAVNHEYVLIYSKNKKEQILQNNKLEDSNGYVFWGNEKTGVDALLNLFNSWKKEKSNVDYLQAKLDGFFKSLSEDDPLLNQSHYKYVDENGIYFAGDISQGTGNGGRFEIIHPITKLPVAIPTGGWRFSITKLPELLQNNRIHFGIDHTTIPCLKRYLHETKFEVAGSVFYKDGRGATKRLSNLLGDKLFDYPKDEFIIQKFIKWVSSGTDKEIILDFFAGSGTLAHSVFLQNSIDGRDRKFICVQLPENIDDNHKAFHCGYEKITQISKDRIFKVGDKIRDDIREQLIKLKQKSTLIQAIEELEKIDKLEKAYHNLDIGFKVFKLDSSNIEAWNTEMPSTSEELKNQLEFSRNHLCKGRTEEDLLFELLLKQGLLLTSPIEEKEFDGVQVFNISHGELFISMSAQLNNKIIDSIGQWAQECIKDAFVDLKPVLVLKDEAFKNDDAFKTNSELRLLNEFGFAKVNTI